MSLVEGFSQTAGIYLKTEHKKIRMHDRHDVLVLALLTLVTVSGIIIPSVTNRSSNLAVSEPHKTVMPASNIQGVIDARNAHDEAISKDTLMQERPVIKK